MVDSGGKCTRITGHINAKILFSLGYLVCLRPLIRCRKVNTVAISLFPDKSIIRRTPKNKFVLAFHGILSPLFSLHVYLHIGKQMQSKWISPICGTI